MWTCASTIPGIIVLPRVSMISASGGISISAAGPTATIRFPSMTTAAWWMGLAS